MASARGTEHLADKGTSRAGSRRARGVDEETLSALWVIPFFLPDRHSCVLMLRPRVVGIV